MSPSPEMVEKARIAIAQVDTCPHDEEVWYCASCKYEWEQTLATKVAEFAQAAVRDAVEQVLELIDEKAQWHDKKAAQLPSFLHSTEAEYWQKNVLMARAETLRVVASALRQKFGVES